MTLGRLFRSVYVARLSMLLLASIAFACGGSSGGGGTGSSGGVKGLCSEAFKGTGASSAANLAGQPAATSTPAPVPLSSCSFDGSRNVVIGSGGCGPNVYVDKSFTGPNGLGSITINSDGQLVFLHDPGYQLDTAGIDVKGVFQVGNSTCPVGSNNKANVAVVNFTDNGGAQVATKGITVETGGTLQLFGATGVAPTSPVSGADPQAPSWTYLTQPAGPSTLYGSGMGVGSPVGPNGATTLSVADFVDWQPGQWIVVAGTDFSPDSAEFVMIDAVKCAAAKAGPCTITLDKDTPLVNYHFGGPAPDVQNAKADGADKNYGVDERAEVGLISRNVKLTSTITGPDKHWGGEIKIMSGYKSVQIQGVEIEKFGKDQVSSYPIHFHMVGDAPSGTLINSNSIHHSYNHCITVHASNNLSISDNVCARIVDHIYYLESGTESGNTFSNNLGIGAMSNAFSISAGNSAALASFWAGDYLTNNPSQTWYNGYDGFNIPFTDNAAGTGATVLGSSTGNTSSGFWITDPGQNTFVGNSIAGCQDVGRGFWILPASVTVAKIPLPKGAFASNRAHGCYTGFDTAADDGVANSVLYIPRGACVGGAGAGTLQNCDKIAEFENLTATRNRNRGIWVRASWYNIESPRLATNRDSISVVSSGGTEGSPPGEWGLIDNPIVVGISTNNPNRFGPCPFNGQNGFGGNAGCYETAANQGNGYPNPIWNMFGVMFYDGPARVEGAKYVNFDVDPTPQLTASDVGFLNYYSANNKMPCGASGNFKYEGDAAMGWFQSNLNSYPPTQYTEDVEFQNVDFRHQIYTESVGATCAPSATGADFRDGDKFTVILDKDATLSGLNVVPAGGGSPISGALPISLNNIPFLAGPGTADECLATGAQDHLLEARPTSLMSPYSYATLEFSALTGCNGVPPLKGPNCSNDNVMIFTKDEIDYPGTGGVAQIQFTDGTITESGGAFKVNCGGTAEPSNQGVKGHACVALSGRNGNGIYEPKLVNGLGYTVQAQKGLPNFVSLMYVDAELPAGISTGTPFHTRVGLCYKNAGNSAPDPSAFSVYKGSKSFAGPNGNEDSLAGFYKQLACRGLDNVLCGPPGAGTAFCFTSLCPSSPFYIDSTTTDTRTPLKAATSISQLEDSTACPNGTCYYYDQASGLLFLNMVQEQPNAGGPYSSPLGSCAGKQAGSDPACAPENFYSYPAPGAELYAVQVSNSYVPGTASACTPYGGATDYTQDYPSTLPNLAYASNNTVVETQIDDTNPAFPHRVPTNEPNNLCPAGAPTNPDWPPAPASAVPTIFTIGLPANVSVTLSPGATPIMTGGSPLYPLTQQSYTLTAKGTACTTGQCTCTQNFTVTGSGWTSSGNNCCGLGTGASNTTIGVAAAPYACAGP